VLLDGVRRDVQFFDDLTGGVAPDDQRDHRDCAPVSPYALSSSELISAAGVGSMTIPICGAGAPPRRDLPVASAISRSRMTAAGVPDLPGAGPLEPAYRAGGARHPAGRNFYAGLNGVTGANGSSPIRVFANDKVGNVWEDDQTQGNHWSGWHKSQHPLI
jgi:hypothetical protein